MTTYPVLSLWQPHATAICHPFHPKTIETRPRRLPPKYLGQWIAIYATIVETYPSIIWDHTWLWEPKAKRSHPLAASTPPARLRWVGDASRAVDIPTPQGAIVGFVRFAESVPIVERCCDEAVHVCATSSSLLLHRSLCGPAPTETDIERQRPWGLWTPGRHAWVTSHQALLPEPVPAKATNQGWWSIDLEVDPDAIEIEIP